MESTIQNDRREKQNKGKQPQDQDNPFPHIQANNEDEGEDSDETTSPPRDEQLPEEKRAEEGRSSILAWLKERLAKEVIAVEEESLGDLDCLLNQTQEITERKKATKMSKVIRDNTGSRAIQIATPRVDKFEGEITVEEYDVETIDLGLPTIEKALSDMNDSVKTVHDMLRMEVEMN